MQMPMLDKQRVSFVQLGRLALLALVLVHRAPMANSQDQGLKAVTRAATENFSPHLKQVTVPRT